MLSGTLELFNGMTRFFVRQPFSLPTFEGNSQLGNLIHWLLTFIIVALMAGILGFGTVAGAGALSAQILFWFAMFVIVLTLSGTIIKSALWR